MSRFFVKFLEVAGAGLASALCAYFLGQIHIGQQSTAVPLPTSPQQIAQVALAAGESVRVVWDAPAAVVETTPTEPAQQDAPQQDQQNDEPPKTPESAAAAPTPAPVPAAAQPPAAAPAPPAAAPAPPAAAPTPTAAPAPKPAKPAHTAQPRRPKLEQTPVVEAKPQQAQPPVAAADASRPGTQGAPAAQSADAGAPPAANAAAEDNRPLFARLRLVPPWFSSGNDKPVERPAPVVPPRPPMPVGDF